MDASIPQTMIAAAIDRFGGPDVLELHTLPVPAPRPDEVLIRLQSAGIGVWDPWVREGRLALGDPGSFPRVIGNDGAGVVVSTGQNARRFRPGEPVYAFSPRGGFYAEYVAVKEEDVAPIPTTMTPREAGALGADGITALRGLDDTLHLEPAEALMIFGASGGIGHLAVQLAKRMGARVLAVASGSDGVDLVRRLGADAALDGHRRTPAGPRRRSPPTGWTPRWCWPADTVSTPRWRRCVPAGGWRFRTASSRAPTPVRTWR